MRDMQVAISIFSSWPGGEKAFLNNENGDVVVIKAELEPQAHACALIYPGHHVDEFVWLWKGRYSLGRALSTGTSLQTPHTNCHPYAVDTTRSIHKTVTVSFGVFFSKYFSKFHLHAGALMVEVR